jgi:protein TonB
VIEDKPLFNGKPAEEGFREYVGSNTKYPPVAAENGITGRVYVEFTIDKDGTVINVKILRGVDPSLDAEALRVIKASPKWTPGRQRGKTVKVKYQFPVNFRLN